MRRPSFPFLVLATVLALLLPLEQAHCLWMGLGALTQAAAPMAKMAGDHSCCRGPAASHGPAQAPECACLKLPTAAVPYPIVVASPRPLPVLFAMLVPSPGVAPAAWTTAPLPAPDVGGPPPLASPRALASRAPPLCA
jgi:hypothetical protein